MARNHEAFLADFEATLRASSLTNGDCFFVPSPTAIAKAMGVSKGMLFHGEPFQAKLEIVTGLNIVHNGIVLANGTDLSPVSDWQSRSQE